MNDATEKEEMEKSTENTQNTTSMPVNEWEAIEPSESTTPTETPIVAAETTSVTPAKPATKKKKWLPWVIAAGVVALAAGGASAYYFSVYQKPENVLLDAYKHMMNAKATQSTGSITFNKNFGQGLEFKSLEVESRGDKTPAGMFSITAKLDYNGKNLSVGGKGVLSTADNGTMYFQLNGLKEMMQAYVKEQGAEGREPAGFYDRISKMQDEWVKVTLDDIKKANVDAGTTYQCVVDTVKKHKGDSDKQWLDMYKAHPFVTVKESLGTKDGLMGYKLALDEGKAKDFGKAAKETALVKELQNCLSSATNGSSNSDSTVDSTIENSDDTVYTFWIDQWTHQLKKVEYSGSQNRGTTDTVNFTGVTTVTYDAKKPVELPASSITFDEFKTRYDAFAEDLGMPKSNTLEQSVSSDYYSDI